MSRAYLLESTAVAEASVIAVWTEDYGGPRLESRPFAQVAYEFEDAAGQRFRRTTGRPLPGPAVGDSLMNVVYYRGDPNIHVEEGREPSIASWVADLVFTIVLWLVLSWPGWSYTRAGAMARRGNLQTARID